MNEIGREAGIAGQRAGNHSRRVAVTGRLCVAISGASDEVTARLRVPGWSCALGPPLAEESGPDDQWVLASVCPVVVGPDERGSAGGEGDLAVEVGVAGAAGGGQRLGQAGHGPGAGGQLVAADGHRGEPGAV